MDTGKAIASLRKEAGYTQASLAEALEVSDKAVSKWERGIACPDISLLPKLSVLLDTDIESLLSGDANVKGTKWNGILLLDHLASVQVYSKPLVYFLLQHFLLVGIRNILIIGGDVKELLGSGEQFGVQFRYSDFSFTSSLLHNQEFINTNTMVVFGNSLIFGANLTRRYQAMMFHSYDPVVMKTEYGQKLPVMFCPVEQWKKVHGRISCWESVDDMIKAIRPVERSFTRGVIALSMNNKDEILTASRFVQIIEQCEDREFANLAEIAQSRGLRIKKLED